MLIWKLGYLVGIGLILLAILAIFGILPIIEIKTVLEGIV